MLRIMRTQDKNKQGDPIFLLQFFNVLYMAVNYCAKFEKKSGKQIIFKGITLNKNSQSSHKWLTWSHLQQIANATLL